MADQTKPTFTDAGIPVASDEHPLTIGADGPIVLPTGCNTRSVL